MQSLRLNRPTSIFIFSTPLASPEKPYFGRTLLWIFRTSFAEVEEQKRTKTEALISFGTRPRSLLGQPRMQKGVFSALESACTAPENSSFCIQLVVLKASKSCSWRRSFRERKQSDLTDWFSASQQARLSSRIRPSCSNPTHGSCGLRSSSHLNAFRTKQSNPAVFFKIKTNKGKSAHSSFSTPLEVLTVQKLLLLCGRRCGCFPVGAALDQNLSK